MQLVNKKNMEVWKDIPGYEGLYQASNLGNIKNIGRKFLDSLGREYIVKEVLCKPSIDTSGYNQIVLSKNKKRKSYKVHRLVAITFIPNPNNLPQVNHKDENKLNNNIENLEWCTHKYNCQYGTRSYRCTLHSNHKVKQLLKGKVIKEYNSLKEASLKTNIKYQGISKCCRQQQRTAGGYEWKYC